jgi:hypothetical protein
MWLNWIHHFLNIFSWNDKVIQECRKLPPIVLLYNMAERSTYDTFRTRGEPTYTILSIHLLRRGSLLAGARYWGLNQIVLQVLMPTVIGDKSDDLVLDTLWEIHGVIVSKYLIIRYPLQWFWGVTQSHTLPGYALLARMGRIWTCHFFLLRPYINFGTSVFMICLAFLGSQRKT